MTSNQRAAETIGDRRRTRHRTDDKIAAAVLDIMRTSGPDAVTMEAVSAQSGVAKTSLYRRYRDRFELMVGVAGGVAVQQLPIPDTVSGRSFTDLVSDLRDWFVEDVGYRAFGRLLASDEAFITVWREKLIGPWVGVLREYFDRGVTAGVLRDGIDYQLIIEYVIGAAAFGDALRDGLPEDWGLRVATDLWQIISVPREA